MRLDTLRAELSDDPLGVGYAGMTNLQVAQAINTESRIEYMDVEVAVLERYLAAEGALLPIRDAAASGHVVAREFVALIDSINVDAFDVRHPRAMAGLDRLVTDGLLSQTQRDAIVALSERAISRAAELGIGTVTADDVMRARSL